MYRYFVWSFLVLAGFAQPASAAKKDDFVDHDKNLMDHGGGHMMNSSGAMVMGQNVDTLPMSCKRITGEVDITVRAGRKYAKNFPGTVFTFDNHEWTVKPCSKVTFHFFNDDNIRHQFMIHGLPKYIYKGGMFHLEVTGPGKISGTIIVPENDQTYLAHCDISQHMEKGMKAQLVVGKGGVSMPGIPGLTPYAIPDSYDLGESGPGTPGPEVNDTLFSGFMNNTPPAPSAAPAPGKPAASASSSLFTGMLLIGLAFGLLASPAMVRRVGGLSGNETYASISTTAGGFVNGLIQRPMQLCRSMATQMLNAENRGRFLAGAASYPARIVAALVNYAVQIKQFVSGLMEKSGGKP
jgi:uncharacterized cupredoxin-like copper-binding protein